MISIGSREDVLVLGGGGREHTLAWKLNQSPKVGEVYTAPGNGGTETIGQNVLLDNFEEIGRFAEEKDIKLTVVGPEKPLVNGIVDYFYENELVDKGHYIFGPRRDAAMLEGSKAYADKFMKEHGVPTAEFEVFGKPEKAKDYISSQPIPIVVKADGLAAGKGSIVCKSLDKAYQAVDWLMGKEFNEKYDGAGERVVIEEFLEGEEATIQALTDGETVKMLLPSQDHKPAYDGDKGPNTGGMGAYAPAPVVSEEVAEKVYDEILTPIIDGMKREGNPYKGLIYPGLMIKDGKPKVVEINARWGDPEAQAVIPLLKNDLYELSIGCIEGNLENHEIENKESAACCVVMTSKGYPREYKKGKIIKGLERLSEDVLTFHAGTRREGAKVLTDGGRVLGVTGLSPDIREAISTTYSAVKKIKWEGEHHRTDIGQKALG